MPRSDENEATTWATTVIELRKMNSDGNILLKMPRQGSV